MFDYELAKEQVWDLCNLKAVPNIRSSNVTDFVVWDLCNLKAVPNSALRACDGVFVWDLCNLKAVPNCGRACVRARAGLGPL